MDIYCNNIKLIKWWWWLPSSFGLNSLFTCSLKSWIMWCEVMCCVMMQCSECWVNYEDSCLYVGWATFIFPEQVQQSADWFLHTLCIGLCSSEISVCAKEFFILLHLPFYIFIGIGLCYGQCHYMLLYLGINGECFQSWTIEWHNICRLH